MISRGNDIESSIELTTAHRAAWWTIVRRFIVQKCGGGDKRRGEQARSSAAMASSFVIHIQVLQCATFRLDHFAVDKCVGISE